MLLSEQGIHEQAAVPKFRSSLSNLGGNKIEESGVAHLSKGVRK